MRNYIQVIVIILLSAAIFIWYPFREPEVQDIRPTRISLSGEFICLPHADVSGPQTEECAFGLKAEDGTYYALDLNLSSALPPEMRAGDHISANGLFTPVEMLSSDHWRNYPVKGIFSVTDSLKKI